MTLLSIKTTIRVKNIQVSKSFYTEVLKMEIVEEYGSDSLGCIIRVGGETGNALIELSQIPEDHYYFDEAYQKNVVNDKIDLQIKTDNVDAWVQSLKGIWEARGPVDRPWGSKYLYLRDPDGIQIIIYQEKSSL